MPRYEITAPNGSRYEINAPEGASNKDIMAFLQTNYDKVEPAKEDDRLFDNALGDFLEAGGTKVQQRGVGLIQLGMEALGQTDNDFYRASQKAATDLQQRQDDLEGFAAGAGEVLGDPINVVGGPLFKGGGYAATAMQAGKFGVLEGLTRATQEGDSRLKNTASSAAVSTVAAPVLRAAGSGIGKAGDYVVNKGKDAYSKVSRFLDKVVDDPVIGLEISAGQTYDDFARAVQNMSDDAVKAFKSASKSGLSPRQSYIAAKAKQEGVTLTRGMLTQDPRLQRLEDYAQQGVLSDKAKNIAQAAQTDNEAAIRTYAGKLYSNVSGAVDDVVDETTVGNRVAEAVRAKAKALKAPASQLYKEGLQSKARVATEDIADFVPALKSALRAEAVDFNASPLFQKQMKTVERLTRKVGDGYSIKSFAWPKLEQLKQNLNSKARFNVNLNQVADYGTRQEILSYRKASSMLNDKLDDLITGNMLRSPDEAAQALRKAPALWKQYRQTIYGKDGKAALGKIVDYDLTDRQVVDLFGSGLAGKGDTQKVVKQLGNALGKDSAEFGQVRGMFLNRLMKGALTKTDEVGAKGFGTALNTQWNQFKTKNKALVDELFTPEMQGEIQDFVSAAYLMHARNASKTNPSGSGIAVMDGAIRLIQNMGGSLPADIARAGAKAALLRGNSRQAIQSISEPMKEFGSNSRIVSDALKRIGSFGGAQAGRTTTAPASQAEPQAPQVTTPGPQSSLSLLDKIALAESGGNPEARNPNSSASGLYQFTNDTWKRLVDKHGERLGIGPQHKNDPQAQRVMAGVLARENADIIQKALKRQPTGGEIYLAHFFGAPDAVKVLRADTDRIAAKVTPRAAKANRNIFFDGKRPRTIGEVRQLLEGKVA